MRAPAARPPLTHSQARRSAKYSLYEGVAAAAAEGASEKYYVPYAIAAGATASHVAWLVTLQQLAIALCYLIQPQFVSFLGSRKKAVLVLVLLDAVAFLPFVVLPFVTKDYLVLSVFVFYVMAAVPRASGPIWASWITDLVPAGERGRFLGLRSTLTSASNVVCFIAVGLILNYVAGSPLIGFSIAFGFAAVTRFASWFLFLPISDVPMARCEEVVSLRHPLRSDLAMPGPLGRFMSYCGMFYFATFLAAPFFAVYMLETLKFSYLTFMVVVCSEQAAKLLILRYWGRRADARGNPGVLKLTSALIPLVPILWLVSQWPPYLVVVQVFSGLAWAGFELCSPNYIYETVPSASRLKYVACFRSLNCLATALGALVGGYVATTFSSALGHPILALFLLSGLLRALVAWKMLPLVFGRGAQRPVAASSSRPGWLEINSMAVRPQVMACRPVAHGRRPLTAWRCREEPDPAPLRQGALVGSAGPRRQWAATLYRPQQPAAAGDPASGTMLRRPVVFRPGLLHDGEAWRCYVRGMDQAATATKSRPGRDSAAGYLPGAVVPGPRRPAENAGYLRPGT